MGLAGWYAPAAAQSPKNPPYSTADGSASQPTVPLVWSSSCNCFAPVDASNPLQVSATVSASIAALAPTGQASLSVGSSSSNVALGSAGPTALVSNTGSNTAYVNFGGSSVTAATSSGYPIPAGWAIAFNVGGNTYIAGITGSSTTTLAITTGTGLPAIAAAGSGGSSANASVGTTGSAVPGSATYLGGLNGSNLQGVAVNGSGQVAIQALAAGTNIIGKAGIDQTTDVTTNGVEIAPTAASAAGMAPVVSSAIESSHVFKGSAGNLYGAYVESSVAGYLLVFNATSAPADGAVTPVECVPAVQAAPSGAYTAFVSYGSGPPASYATGITAAYSTTGCFSKTASATGFFKGSVK